MRMMLQIINKDKKQEDIKEINKLCSNNGSGVMILGIGVYATAVCEYLKANGVTAPISFVLDDVFYSEEMKDKNVISFSEYIKECAETYPLVFGFYNYDIVLNKREQYRDVIPHMFDFHMTVIGDVKVDWNYDYVMEHIDEFNETFHMLSSANARNTMEGYINAAAAGRFHEFYMEFKDEIPYFNEKLGGMRIDRLFDCGAFDGDSAHDFISVYSDYEHIYEFEPDPENVKKIEARVKNESIRDLSIIQKGVWSETTTLRFASEGKSSSNVSDEGDISIDVIKLDDMYSEFTRNSLIKMDIEGSELAALKGAEKVIKEISPALAICVYHKRDDLITIPQYINGIVKPGTYDYYVGYQGLDLAEFVFYAIPKDR